MNKQQLAARIWAMANDMRSKIAANEYKDFILGFMFYKFLSDKELQLLQKEEFTDEEIQNLSEDDKEMVNFIKKEIGFFISYKDLFSTWVKMGNEFDVSKVRDALSNFNNNINDGHKNVYDGIFNTLETGLSKLGENTKSQTIAVNKIIGLINTIPMDSNSDYDVLGFIYEYLISNFAANAGKKAGEFYTPHEVSILMSEIIANHLKDSEQIKIYDPTSGSGSLLINIGKAVAKHVKDPKSIIYYAQELKSETYNLTRMNLVMRGISSHNIHARNADTLEEDWPINNEEGSFDPLYLDAVVSNPPYSQKWDPSGKSDDPRYSGYGVAPQGKADYAFLLHDLYHIKPTGIMTIVLPHGVLFRGGEEYEIRKNLIDKNKIDAIIGLPANIFFGTGIPTIIMVLKKQKNDDCIQIIDASKYFIKEGKNNKLRTSDIKRIVDSILARKDKEKFSKVVTKQEIINNDYNLNILRYVDSSESPEKWDIYSTMFGGIPAEELDEYNHYFELFPGLKEELFIKSNEKYYDIKSQNINDDLLNNASIKSYKTNFEHKFSPFYQVLKRNLIDNYENINISSTEKELGNQLFDLLDDIKLVDNYDAYQILSDTWNSISGNLEILKTEGLNACRKVDENIIYKKDDKSKELIPVQDGYKGRIFNFETIKKYKLKNEVGEIQKENEKLNDITSQYEEIFSNLTEDQQEGLGECIDEENFVNKEITAKAKELKKEKNQIYGKDTVEYIILEVDKLIENEKALKKKIKTLEEELLSKIMYTIEHLTDEEIIELLEHQWIEPIMNGINGLFETKLKDFSDGLENLRKKYEITLSDVENKIKENGKILSEMVADLTGDDFDIKGLDKFKSLLNE